VPLRPYQLAVGQRETPGPPDLEYFIGIGEIRFRLFNDTP
jgi:hypothetical protein